MEGTKFGLLTVLRFHHRDERSRRYWECRCACGSIRVLQHESLKRFQSCGCERGKNISRAKKTHGYAGSVERAPEYRAWSGMLQRCQNPNNPAFEDYGARGIKVCKRWSKFENFLEDMGERPSSRHSIDRKNNDRGYSKSNCRWATRSEQNSNKRGTRKISWRGQTKTLTAWANLLGIKRCTIAKRLTLGWSVQEALSIPSRT